ncbi:OLC1v1022038C1 [Oldenlandia corymbosa var. corymbosa]|uniref:OLC1v1022038C1 n=1 Tax=Oldenlandia corymbosa var. corymbosa TaxID=529605 RepID=A0AAV1BX04_OLDCO|nr:OLC1v1022038C1 [Oldenlandia corymbosa var. corymbosa]
MEYSLYKAAFNSDIDAVTRLLQEDPMLIQKTYVMYRVDRNPIHICAMMGYVECLNVILLANNSSFSYAMCLARDQHGHNPIHLAAIHGQLAYWRWLKNEDIIKYLIENVCEIVDVKNENGKTALDIFKDRARKQSMEEYQGAISCLEGVRGAAKKDCFLVSFEDSKDSIMIVASLIATIAFQAMVSPPGGVWQDNLYDKKLSIQHKVGESVMALTQPEYYKILIRSNTIAFLASLTTIIMLMIRERPARPKTHIFRTLALLLLIIGMSLSVTAISIAYATMFVAMAPEPVLWHWGSSFQITMIAITVWFFPLIAFVTSAIRYYRGGMNVKFWHPQIDKKIRSGIKGIFPLKSKPNAAC